MSVRIKKTRKLIFTYFFFQRALNKRMGKGEDKRRLYECKERLRSVGFKGNRKECEAEKIRKVIFVSFELLRRE